MLDLCHALHVKSASIYRSWADGGAEVSFFLFFWPKFLIIINLISDTLKKILLCIR